MSRMFGLTRYLIPVLLGMAFAGCERPSERSETATGAAGHAPIKVAASIPPQAFFIKQVGGDHVDVTLVLSPGQSPHAFEPTPKQIADLSETALFFTIGLPFEQRLAARLTEGGTTVVDTREGIPLRRAAGPCAHDHDDGHVHEPDGAKDPHFWMNPRLVKIQAETICMALERADPEHAEVYRRNCMAFAAALDAVDGRIAKALKPLEGRPLFVFHPAYGYFADAYGMKQVAVEVEGKEPTARDVVRLVEQARTAGVRVIFVQPQFSPKCAEAIAREIDGEVVPIDPLCADYLSNLELMTARICAGSVGDR